MNTKQLLVSLFALCLGTLAAAQTQTIRAFSHRGGRLENDENTLSAFAASRDLGYNGYETDIRMTADGVLVIMHDHTLERTTNGIGIVEQSTWAELQGLQTKGGHKILRLEELMDFLKDQQGLYVEFELKTNPRELYPMERLEEYCEKVWDIVMADVPQDADFLLTSSDTRAIKYLVSHHPEGKYSVIFGEGVNSKTIAVAKALGVTRIACVMDNTTRRDMEQAKAEGLTVILWPTGKIEDFLLGVYLGAEYICTDIPGEVMRFMTQNMPWVKMVY